MDRVEIVKEMAEDMNYKTLHFEYEKSSPKTQEILFPLLEERKRCDECGNEMLFNSSGSPFCPICK